MRNLLTNILLLASTAMALPAPQASPRPETCVTRSSRSSKWIVEDFDFHASYIFSTPSHQNSWGYVNFTLANPVLSYKPVCTAASNWLSDFYYGNTIYSCDVPAEGDKATFTYDRAGGALRINQTWNCVEEGGRFVAGGGTVLDLQCEETNWQNPDWKQGQFYSTRDIKCTPVTVDAPIETLSAVL